MRKVVFITIALGCTLIAAESKYDITPTVGGVFPEKSTQLKDQLSAGLRVGQYFDNQFISKIEGGVEFAAAHYKPQKQQALLTRYFLHVVKEFEISKDTYFYGLVGAGYENIRKKSRYGNDDSPYANYGIGLRYAVTDNLYLRTELRHAIKFTNHGGDNNIFATLGISYVFGEELKPSVVVEPVEEEVATEEGSVAEIQQTVATETKEETETKAEAETEVVDSDNDGIPDDNDLCPNTPAEFSADDVGCVKTIALKVNFATNEANVPGQFNSDIESVAKILNSETDYEVIIEGHTDSTGTKEWNLKLSEERAKNVAQELVRLGVDESRITTEWFGEEKPVASNETPEGRAENRRIEAIFVK
ncbi:MAG: OmpA family protein [Campylobacteraceae bacterium]|jgi:OOP family OmpA-OmpF porin|nr:OmpA family protein [Campylobacteraceae bacterium]